MRFTIVFVYMAANNLGLFDIFVMHVVENKNINSD